MVNIILAVLGLCLGSLANAIAWRIKRGKNWLNGRSECDNCHHQLGPVDLIPIASWLLSKGRCRYCKKKVSIQYPLTELAEAVVLVSSYLFWPGGLAATSAKFLFAGWVIISVGLLILAIYDFNYRLLPSKIIYPTLLVAVAIKIFYLAKYSSHINTDLLHWGLSVAIASGIFYLLYELSHGEWIGFGDVRLGLITGTVLAQPKLSFLMIFLSSLLGLAVTLPGVISGKKHLSTKLPYGPCLIVATWLVLLFGQAVINWYNHHLL